MSWQVLWHCGENKLALFNKKNSPNSFFFFPLYSCSSFKVLFGYYIQDPHVSKP